MLHEIPPQNPGEPGEYAVRCDVPGCDLEIAGATEEEAMEAACLIGFKFEKGGLGRCACPDCGKGVSPAIQAVKAQLQAQAAAALANAMVPDPADQAPPASGGDPTGWLN